MRPPVRGSRPQQPRGAADPSATRPAFMNNSGSEPNSPGYLVERDGAPLGYVLARNVALGADRPSKSERAIVGQPAASPNRIESATQDATLAEQLTRKQIEDQRLYEQWKAERQAAAQR